MATVAGPHGSCAAAVRMSGVAALAAAASCRRWVDSVSQRRLWRAPAVTKTTAQTAFAARINNNGFEDGCRLLAVA